MLFQEILRSVRNSQNYTAFLASVHHTLGFEFQIGKLQQKRREAYSVLPLGILTGPLFIPAPYSGSFIALSECHSSLTPGSQLVLPCSPINNTPTLGQPHREAFSLIRYSGLLPTTLLAISLRVFYNFSWSTKMGTPYTMNNFRRVFLARASGQGAICVLNAVGAGAITMAWR